MLQTVIRPSIDKPSMTGTSVLGDCANAAAGSRAGQDRQYDVFGRGTFGEFTIDGDCHRLLGKLRQRLGCEDMFDLAGADTKCDRTERTMGAGVAVTADHRHARKRQPELGADDVNDALVLVAHRVVRDTKLGRVRTQRVDLFATNLVGDRQMLILGWHVVVFGRQPSDQVGEPFAPFMRRPSKACGEVTSCTKCKSI